MIKTKAGFSILQPLILVPLVWLVAGFFFIHNKVEDLKYEKYENSTKEINDKLQTLIQEKQEAIELVSLTLSEDKTIKDSLLSNSIADLNLHLFSTELADKTSLKHTWFQIITPDGNSFYRSWTDKRGDKVTKVRHDIAKVIRSPKLTSSISAGKFDLTFKAIVPIYNNKKFIGLIETISKFNSITKKMKQNNYETIVLVDKIHKKNFINPFTNTFIKDYYVANMDVDQDCLTIVKNRGVAFFINRATFYINLENNKLINTYHFPDINGKKMAYFIVFQDLDTINFHNIIRVRNSLILFVISIFIFLIGLSYYLYNKKYKQFMQEMNINLEQKVQIKTQELENQSKKLEHLAQHDFLTKLPNRMLLIDRLKQSIKHAKRTKKKINVLFLDLDRFKEINDTYGHEVGDTLLKNVANRLNSCIREEDTIARLGGDEFTIILNSTDEIQTIAVANKIIDIMHDSITIDDIELHSTFSIGISTFPDDGNSPDILLRNADTAMYEAKDSGKNTYRFYNSKMTELAFERVLLENNLRKAIEHKEFEAYFQPKIDARTDKVIGLEALIRWNHPELGLIPPVKFIPFAESIGLIIEIDKWMMREATTQVLKWKNEGIKTGKLSINASAKQLENKNCIRDLNSLINTIGFNPKDLEIEITEGQIMKSTQHVTSVLNKIREIGISISIDDFGTGYSSLSYLKRLPIDKLKIDRSFIKDIPEDQDDIAIVKTIIALANNLSLELIAEGVETEQQKNFLFKEGCHNIQGYLYSKPLPADKCREFLIKHMS